MKRVADAVDVLALVGVVAAIMMLVRPGSHGPAMVRGISEAFMAAVAATVGAELEGPKAKRPSANGKNGDDGGGFDFPSVIPGPYNEPGDFF